MVAAVVGSEERAEVEREWKRWQRQVAVRRRICRELWDRCSEVVPEGVTREELWVCVIVIIIFITNLFLLGWVLMDVCRNRWGWRGVCDVWYTRGMHVSC